MKNTETIKRAMEKMWAAKIKFSFIDLLYFDKYITFYVICKCKKKEISSFAY